MKSMHDYGHKQYATIKTIWFKTHKGLSMNISNVSKIIIIIKNIL